MASDILCPWCYVGKLRLQKAIDSLGVSSQVDLFYRPHILYPHIPDEGKDVKESKSLKHVEANLVTSAALLGVQFDLPAIKRVPQTRAIHRALSTLDKSAAWKMKEVLFKAYFSDGQDLTDQETLVALFEEHGHIFRLSDVETLEKLLAENRILGISAVPTFILDNDISVTGAQPIDRWENYLSKKLR